MLIMLYVETLLRSKETKHIPHHFLWKKWMFWQRQDTELVLDVSWHVFSSFLNLIFTAGRWMFILLALLEDLAWCRTSCAWYVVLWREVVIGWFANTTRWMAKLHTTIFRRLPGCQCRCLDFASFDVISHPCWTIWYLRWVWVGWMMDCYQKNASVVWSWDFKEPGIHHSYQLKPCWW